MPTYKNLIGSGFPDYINDQIKQRQKIISSNNRSNSTLQFLNNRNVWVRLSSGANIDGNAEKAQLNTLQGGTIFAGATQTRIRGGFNETYSKGNEDDLGLKPMPGITNVSMGTKGKWQTLMEADVEFICYNLDQLDTMTKLYMSLGCHVFLEWGHSNYFKNDGTFEINPSPIEFFSTNKKDKILKLATEKRKNSDGNYECLLGRVQNFDWTANNDGSYNCKIQIIGEGGIAESLRINTASKVNFDIFRAPEDDGGTYSSTLENILSTLKEIMFQTTGIVEKKSRFSSDSSLKLLNIKELQEITFNKTFNSYFGEFTYGAYLNLIYRTSNYKGPTFNGGSISNGENISDNVKFGNAYQVISGLGTATELKPELYYGYLSGASVSDSKTFSSYITLAHLFTLIQHIGIFCEGDNNSNEPVVYLDYNVDNTIVKSTPFQASIDPSKCLIPYNVTKSARKELFTDEIISDNKLSEKLEEITSLSIKQVIPKFDNKLFNVLINIDFALDTFKSLSSINEDKSVSLMGYITKILDGVNVSLGKLNSFRPFFDKDSNCIRIIDENKINDSLENKPAIEINNFGTNSTVYDYSFNSKITPKMATQIVIASQASDEGLEEFAEEVLSFQHLNKGIKDRLGARKIPGISVNKKLTEDPKVEVQPQVKLFKHFYNIYTFEKLKLETIDELTTLYADLQKRYDNKLIIDPNTGKKPTAAIPIEYSIKMDGISGILPYNIFRIPEDRLPKQYRATINTSGVDFGVFSINHEVENNKWYTILRGQILTRN